MLGNAHVDALVCQRGLASVAWQIDPQLMNKLHKTNSEWLSDCQNLWCKCYLGIEMLFRAYVSSASGFWDTFNKTITKRKLEGYLSCSIPHRATCSKHRDASDTIIYANLQSQLGLTKNNIDQHRLTPRSKESCGKLFETPSFEDWEPYQQWHQPSDLASGFLQEQATLARPHHRMI